MADQKISVLTELAETPASADEFVVVDKSDTTMGATGTNKRVQAQYLTIADATASVKGKSLLAEGQIHAATEKTTPADADELGLIDSAASYVLKKLTFLNLKVAIMSALNPIGTIREFNVSTNPATLLGFGTWTAFGAGRVTVAIDAGQTEFDTNGETGGEKTHLLLASESGEPGHNHGGTTGSFAGGASDGIIASSGSARFQNAATHSHSIPTQAAANAASAHNNLQPYIVVYRWVRSA